MKSVIKIAICILIAAWTFMSCKKEPVQITPPAPKNAEYDLDITLNTTYNFSDNISDPWQYVTAESNFDLTNIIGKANLPPLGEFEIYVWEYADTATLSNKIYWDNINISLGHVDPLYISGEHSINFKKLIREGGGAFNGTLKITNGSAQKRDRNIFSSLPPLTVTGTLDVNTHLVNLRIKGKTYF